MEFFSGQYIPILLIGFSVPLSYMDIRHRRLPLTLTLPALGTSVICRMVWSNPMPFILTGAAGFLFILIIRHLTRGGIGLGDALISAFMGVLLGYRGWLTGITAGSLLALISITILIILKQTDRKTGIPFAPFLFAGGIISFLITIH